MAAAAYLDIALPIACGQTISQPFVVSYMTEKLALERDHDVLEIGTGSGYQTAILATLCRHVYTIERHETLLEEARLRLARLGIANVTGAVRRRHARAGPSRASSTASSSPRRRANCRKRWSASSRMAAA